MMTGTWNFFMIYFTSFADTAKTNLTFLSKRSNFQHPSLRTHSAAKHYIRWSFTDWLCKRSETKLYCMFFNPIMKNLTKVPTWLKYACWNNWWNARHIQKHGLRVTGKPIRASPIKSTGGAKDMQSFCFFWEEGVTLFTPAAEQSGASECSDNGALMLTASP